MHLSIQKFGPNAIRAAGFAVLVVATLALGEVANTTFLVLAGVHPQMLIHLGVATTGFVALWIFNHGMAAFLSTIIISVLAWMGHAVTSASLSGMAALAIYRGGDRALDKADKVREMATNLNLYEGWGVSFTSYGVIGIVIAIVLYRELIWGELNRD